MVGVTGSIPVAPTSPASMGLPELDLLVIAHLQDIANKDARMRRFGDTAIITGTSVQSGVSNGQP